MQTYQDADADAYCYDRSRQRGHSHADGYRCTDEGAHSNIDLDRNVDTPLASTNLHANARTSHADTRTPHPDAPPADSHLHAFASAAHADADPYPFANAAPHRRLAWRILWQQVSAAAFGAGSQ